MAQVLKLDGSNEGFGFELPDGSRYTIPYPNRLPLSLALRLSRMHAGEVSDSTVIEFLISILEAYCPEAIDKLDIGMATQLFTAWAESARPTLGES